MKIGHKQQDKAFRQSTIWFAILILLFVAGLFITNQAWQIRLRHTLTALSQKVVEAFAFATASDADLPTLVIDMDFTAYDALLDQRTEALRDMMFVPSEGDFVAATARLTGESVPIDVRLSGGLARNLGDDDKWGLEIRTRQGQTLLGTGRFYLIDPALNNGLAQQAFVQALEREGILVARYHFVRLVLNGADWGIYALQDSGSRELLVAQGRPEGAVVQFDADLLWTSIAHFYGEAPAAYADPVTNLSASDFQYFEIDTYRDATFTDEDDISDQQREQYARAIGMLRALQAGEVRASEVFDVALYGRLLALADLWSATEAVSLVNLRYYYNPTTDRLEPISFSANPLTGDARLSLAATYGDPALQAAYAREAVRLSQPDYVDRLAAELGPDLARSSRALGGQYGHTGDIWDRLRARQDRVRRSLEPVQPVLAYLGSPTLTMSGTVRIDVGNVINLPVEVLGFDVNGATFLTARRYWLPETSADLLTERSEGDGVVLRALDATRVPAVRYVRFDVPLAEIHRQDDEHDFTQALEVQVVTRILGLDETRTTLARPGYPDIVAPVSPTQ